MYECPSLYELTSGSFDEDEDLRAHVADCVRCSALLKAWGTGAEPDEEDLGADGGWDLPAGALRFETAENLDAPPVAGAVHAAWAPGRDTFLIALVVAMDEVSASVLPVSRETWAASDEDVLLAEEVLGYPAMAERWNRIDILLEQVAERLADPSSQTMALVEAKSWTSPTSTGPRIASDNDPRLGFREDERERAAFYAEPSRRLGVAETFSGVVKLRRAEKQRELEEVAAAVDLPPLKLEQLEGGTLDLYAEVPVPALGRLVDHLELQPSRRLYALVEEAAFRTHSSAGYGDVRMAARRRAGSRTRRRQQPEEVRRLQARQYAEALRGRLEG